MKEAGRRSDLPRNLPLPNPQLGRNEYKWLDEKQIYSESSKNSAFTEFSSYILKAFSTRQLKLLTF